MKAAVLLMWYEPFHRKPIRSNLRFMEWCSTKLREQVALDGTEGCQSTILQRRTCTFQTFLQVRWGAAALYGQSLSAVDTEWISAAHTLVDTFIPQRNTQAFTLFSHESCSCRKEWQLISCMSRGQLLFPWLYFSSSFFYTSVLFLSSYLHVFHYSS